MCESHKNKSNFKEILKIKTFPLYRDIYCYPFLCIMKEKISQIYKIQPADSKMYMEKQGPNHY